MCAHESDNENTNFPEMLIKLVLWLKRSAASPRQHHCKHAYPSSMLLRQPIYTCVSRWLYLYFSMWVLKALRHKWICHIHSCRNVHASILCTTNSVANRDSILFQNMHKIALLSKYWDFLYCLYRQYTGREMEDLHVCKITQYHIWNTSNQNDSYLRCNNISVLSTTSHLTLLNNHFHTESWKGKLDKCFKK